MDPAILSFPLLDIGGWLAVVSAIVLAMARGWLVTATQQDRLIAVYKELLTDKDRQIAVWQETARLSDARGDLLAANQDKLLDVGRTTNELIRSIGGGVGR